MPDNRKLNKHDRQNMKRAVAKRHEEPSEPKKFPNKNRRYTVLPGKKGETTDDPKAPSQTGDAAPHHRG